MQAKQTALSSPTHGTTMGPPAGRRGRQRWLAYPERTIVARIDRQATARATPALPAVPARRRPHGRSPFRWRSASVLLSGTVGADLCMRNTAALLLLLLVPVPMNAGELQQFEHDI